MKPHVWSMDTWFCHAVLLFSIVATLKAQPVCWQAVVRCHEERECKLAYSQYLVACDGNIRGTARRCPSHCIGALIRLNDTTSGPDLETCDCGSDSDCLRTKLAIEPCLPRRHAPEAYGIGCTEARQRCEKDVACSLALSTYLSHCGQLFNGRKCSTRCRNTIEQLRLLPDGAMLERCTCDGVERPFCEVVKDNMSRLCSIGDLEVATDHEVLDDFYEDENYEFNLEQDTDSVVSSSHSWYAKRHQTLLRGSLVFSLFVAWPSLWTI